MFTANPPIEDYKPITKIDLSTVTEPTILTVAEFMTGIETGLYTKTSGYGHPSNGTAEDRRHDIYPHKPELLPTAATHIHWFST